MPWVYGLKRIWIKPIPYSLVTCSQVPCEFRYNNVWILGAEEYDTITTDRFGGSEINFSSYPPELKSHPKGVGMSTEEELCRLLGR